MSAEDAKSKMELRAVTIQFLKALEDRLVAAGRLPPEDRACLTRQERREREREAVDSGPLSGV